MWNNSTNSQRLLIMFSRDGPYSIQITFLYASVVLVRNSTID